MRRFIYERSATNIRDWSLAYSFIYYASVCVQFVAECLLGALVLRHVVGQEADGRVALHRQLHPEVPRAGAQERQQS